MYHQINLHIQRQKTGGAITRAGAIIGMNTVHTLRDVSAQSVAETCYFIAYISYRSCDQTEDMSRSIMVHYEGSRADLQSSNLIHQQKVKSLLKVAVSSNQV